MKKVTKFITILLLAILIPCIVLVCVILGASFLGKDFKHGPVPDVSTEASSAADAMASSEESVSIEETAVSEEVTLFEEPAVSEEASLSEELGSSEAVPVVEESLAADSSNPSLKITKELTEAVTFTLNTDSKKFHFTDCSSAEQITPSNLAYFTGTREDAITLGYSPCENCNP